MNRQQPRSVFDETAIEDLAASIRACGIIQPLIVTPSNAVGDRYELIAGERRLRAARLAGLTEVPVIVRKEVSTEELLELAIIENLQREDLNPIEEAKAFHSMIEQCDYTQDDVAKKLGKSRSYIANSLRLLQLPKVVQDDVVQGRMDMGHARALLSLNGLQEQLTVREQILQSQLTVRDVERMVQARTGRTSEKKISPSNTEDALSPQMRYIIDEMRQAIGTKVILRPRSAKSGAVVIEYYSLQDLDRIYRKIASK